MEDVYAKIDSLKAEQKEIMRDIRARNDVLLLMRKI